jgi:hypothetical protein
MLPPLKTQAHVGAWSAVKLLNRLRLLDLIEVPGSWEMLDGLHPFEELEPGDSVQIPEDLWDQKIPAIPLQVGKEIDSIEYLHVREGLFQCELENEEIPPGVRVLVFIGETLEYKDIWYLFLFKLTHHPTIK